MMRIIYQIRSILRYEHVMWHNSTLFPIPSTNLLQTPQWQALRYVEHGEGVLRVYQTLHHYRRRTHGSSTGRAGLDSFSHLVGVLGSRNYMRGHSAA